MNAFTKIFALSTIGILVYSCGGGATGGQDDTHSRGKAEIYFEESYKPLFETSIYTFGFYFFLKKCINIQPVYKTEGEIINAFFEKKVKTICITRDFTPKEKANLKKAQIEVRSNMIAFDAVALIIHPDNIDSTLSIDKLKRILTGKDTLRSGEHTSELQSQS